MKRNRFLTGAAFASIALAALAVAPARAAAPFGSFGGKVGGGNAGSAQMPIFGWALDDNGIAAVDIMVDGIIVGRSTYGRSRPQVTRQFPGYPDSALPGFAYQLDTTRLLNGQHRVQPRVLSKSGEVTLLNSRVFEFNNVTHNLIPFGKIDFPNPNAEMRGRCVIDEGLRRYSIVSGWALDSGVQADDTGIGYVELLIDRAELSNTQSDCTFDANLGGLTDCYGVRRLDIENQFPGLPNSPHAGWRFALDIGQLIHDGYRRGAHTITIRSGDLFGQVVNIAEMPVNFSCDSDLANENSFGLIGYPTKALTYAGTVEARGWALDFEGVFSVQVLVDGVFQGLATTGIPSPNVHSNYPSYLDSSFANWSFLLDTTQFSNGRHSLNVVVVDDRLQTTLIGERDFQIGNPL